MVSNKIAHINLLMSSGYICNELAAEIGKIPPIFIPLANRYLFEWQSNFLGSKYDDSAINIVTLPIDYELSDFETNIIRSNNFQILRVDPTLSLFEGLVEVVNKISDIYNLSASLTLLLGDTTFLRSAKGVTANNTIVISKNYAMYHRSVWEQKKDDKRFDYKLAQSKDSVWSGLCSFESIFTLNTALQNSTTVEGCLNHVINSLDAQILTRNDWVDCGHVNSFFHARALISTSRSFNNVTVTNGIVYKTSETKSAKIEDEIRWYQALDEKLMIHTPKLLAVSNDPGYSLEYEPAIPLNELWISSKMSPNWWENLKYKLCDLIDLLLESGKGRLNNKKHAAYVASYTEKNLGRISQYPADLLEARKYCKIEYNRQSISPYDAVERLQETNFNFDSSKICFSHGDLCFSNLLYDSRKDRVLMLDPRGINSIGIGNYADLYFEISKLWHSVFGYYDHILGGRVILEQNSAGTVKLNLPYLFEGQSHFMKAFERYFIAKYQLDEKRLLAHVALLFFSMIPLHSDDPGRQNLLLINAYRIFEKWRNI